MSFLECNCKAYKNKTFGLFARCHYILNPFIYFQDLVPMDTQTQISNSKEHIRVLYNSIKKFKDISERMVMRATGYAGDMLQFGRELR